MSEAIIFLTETELAISGKFNSKASEVLFKDITYVKGANFSLKLKEQAMKYCRHKANFNHKSLLIESEYGFTIWTQKETGSETKTNELDSNQASEINDSGKISQNKTSKSSNDLASVKKYRGQVYDPNQPSLSLASSSTKKEKSQPLLQRIIHKYRSQADGETSDTSEIESASKKPRRKYRGQYID